MDSESRLALQTEWQTLQQGVERSEAMSLGIKLFAVVVLLSGLAFKLSVLTIALLLLVLWFQEAIWTTFQARSEAHLLSIEQSCNEDVHQSAFTFHSHWRQSRPGGLKLVADYCSSAIRPTIAYPYVVLILIDVVTQILPGIA